MPLRSDTSRDKRRMGTIPEWVGRLLSLGTDGQPRERVRQISLVNELVLYPFTATIPYQVFYLIHDPGYYLPLLLANVGFMACYVAVPFMNRARMYRAARNTALVVVHLQIIVVTYFIGAGSGVHLFFFPIATWLGLFSSSSRTGVVLTFGVAAFFFLLCHFLFPAETAPLAIPGPALPWVFAGTAIGAMVVGGVVANRFRREIDRAEAALTRSNEELARLSGLDPLTGLANRRTLDDFLARECARLRRPGQQIAVILCDVDHFKAYNDYYGHLAGDACLKQVADVLSTVVRRVNDVVARYGGEEFVLVLPSTDCAGALGVAEEARARVSALRIPHERSDVAPIVTLSVGVACSAPANPLAPEDLLRRADAALYEAKRAGRNRVMHYA